MSRDQNSFVRYSETFKDPHALLQVCGERQMEGIVSNRIDRSYRSGPTKDWIKVKYLEWREENASRHEFFAKR